VPESWREHGLASELARARLGRNLRATCGKQVGTEWEQFCLARRRELPSKLLVAAHEGNVEGVARLLAAGADPNAGARCQFVNDASGNAVESTALAAAAVNGQLEAARLLLEGGADPSMVNGAGASPLMCAATTGQLEVLRLLLQWGAAVDAVEPSRGLTAFHFACGNNNPRCAEALARAGCNVGLKHNNGCTGRQTAEREGFMEVVARLRSLELERLAGGGGAAAGGKKKRKKRPKKKAAVTLPGAEPEPEPEPDPELQAELDPNPEPEPEPEPEPAADRWDDRLIAEMLEGLGTAEIGIAEMLEDLGLLDDLSGRHILAACRVHEMDLGARPQPSTICCCTRILFAPCPLDRLASGWQQ
jgi:hypothetical protein